MLSSTSELSKSQYRLLFFVVLIAAIFLRTQQLLSQVLIDDEWHAIHRILVADYQQIFLSFGHSDYSIPLTLYYRFVADHFGLSEIAMRWPMLLAGIVTVYVAIRHLEHKTLWGEAISLGALLAVSPLLINYSRIARPYALALLCALSAVVLFVNWYTTKKKWLAFWYLLTAIFGTWALPVVGPLVVAPFLWALYEIIRTKQYRQIAPVFVLGFITALGLCLFILPPLLADPSAMAVKSGWHLPNAHTYLGALYLWLGTGKSVLLALSLALSVYGAPLAFRAFRNEHLILAIGVVLLLAVIYSTRPMWAMHSLVLARYALILCPILLLWMAFGIVRLSAHFAAKATAVWIGLTLILCLSTIWFTLREPLRTPNAYQSHSEYQMEWRHAENPIRKYLAQFPRSPFWLELAKLPTGSERIAAGPYAFESYNNIFHEWQRISHQNIIPLRLQGYCMPVTGGESIDARFPLRNQIQADDLPTLQKQSIDWVVLAKPFMISWDGKQAPSSPAITSCMAFFDARLGMRFFEDESIVVYKVPKL